MSRSLRLAIRRGNAAAAEAACLITSANDSLVGNSDPAYWRFISRENVDGALRSLAGPDLEAACLAIPVLPSSGVRRDITRWTIGVKKGPSAAVRCPAGSAVATAATGRLRADHVIHTVAPDSEFGYEGLYHGDVRGAGSLGDASAHAGSSTRRHASWQQFSPPDHLLLAAYSAAFEQACGLGSSSVACPALGSGVKGWRHSISAALALEAMARLLVADASDASVSPSVLHFGRAHRGEERAGSGSSPLVGLEFVIGGPSYIADKAWRDWISTAHSLLGPPPGLEQPEAFREAALGGALHWELPYGLSPARETEGSPQADDFAGSECVLPIADVKDVREMLRNRSRGAHTSETPLTPEQELRAVHRRSTR